MPPRMTRAPMAMAAIPPPEKPLSEPVEVVLSVWTVGVLGGAVAVDCGIPGLKGDGVEMAGAGVVPAPNAGAALRPSVANAMTTRARTRPRGLRVLPGPGTIA